MPDQLTEYFKVTWKHTSSFFLKLSACHPHLFFHTHTYSLTCEIINDPALMLFPAISPWLQNDTSCLAQVDILANENSMRASL